MAKKYHDSKMSSKNFANMPTEVIFKEYGEIYDPMMETLDDTEAGIREQVKKDVSVRNKITKPRKA